MRLNAVKSLRTFFASYRKALDAFNQSLQKATQQLDKEIVKGGEPDSVASAIAKVKTSMEAVNKGMAQRVECFEKELVEPMDVL